nr:hypothetical protein [uncultured Sphingorhabdus sp.]
MARMTIGSPYAPHDIGTINLEKGRWIEPAALKHGSAIGRPLPEVAFMP